jgi:hypothetical protein
MKGMSLRAVIALVLAGGAAFAAVRARDRRRALAPGPLGDVPDGSFTSEYAGSTASGEGMPGGE